MNGFTPPSTLFELNERVLAALPANQPIYLVGGAVRDILLGRPTHDLDFVLPGDAVRSGRQIARDLAADFFPIDPERDTGRVILASEQGKRTVLDFASYRGPDLESDLRGRDFTINAIAINLRKPRELIDPLGGARDLHDGVLRICSPTTFRDDPVRILRCIRQAFTFNLKILPETKQALRKALPGLSDISAERIRDELFRILDSPAPASALRALDIFSVLPLVLPELESLKGVTQPAPHSADVWTHTLSVVEKLAALLNVLAPYHDPERDANWIMGLISLRLGRFRQQLDRHLSTAINPDRSIRSLLLMAALYHDVGKAKTYSVDEEGRIRFLEHELVGAQMVSQRARRLHLNNDECERLKIIVRNHMRPLLLAQLEDQPSRRAIYRFFRATGEAGVDICYLSLADALGTYGSSVPEEKWIRQLEVIRLLLESWWERPDEEINPPALLGGRDLMRELGIPPGRQVGQLLEAIREAQAAGELENREQALDFGRAWLFENR
jgi:putative nucleotidyltransferase with HDIG domain